MSSTRTPVAALIPSPRPPVDDAAVTVRPLQPDDLERLRRFGAGLSPETWYLRFFTGGRHLPEPVLRRLVELDHVGREALAALAGDEIVAVARYERSRTAPEQAEAAVTVTDAWQRRGIGPMLLDRLGSLALSHGITTFTATVLADNDRMTRVLRRRWPAAWSSFSDGVREYALPLAA
jgi:GNAT superfamily N-acetyltransferase